MVGAPTLTLSAFAPYRLYVLARMMSEQLGAAYADEGLTIPEWRVLAVVSQAQAMAARDVVALTPMDKMAVSRAVSSLEAKQLIMRSRGEDRRISELHLSERGREVFERVARIAQGYEERALSALSDAERTSLFEAMAKIEKTLRAIDRKTTA